MTLKYSIALLQFSTARTPTRFSDYTAHGKKSAKGACVFILFRNPGYFSAILLALSYDCPTNFLIFMPMFSINSTTVMNKYSVVCP